ncbi:MAG TPA: ABC transporter substrate-binding protein [Pseudonocardiaceae bacterium]|jgi:multiple sugar transport system substrate-binding protein|nr:ABC transporter substrate-binding protein [Pseudonocardiaceae bacterium]
MIISRSRVAAVLGLATLLGVTACGVGTPSAGPAGPVAQAPELAANQHVSIVFESYNFGLAGAWTDTFKALISAFEKKYPNITVTPQKPTGSDPNPAHNAASSVQEETAAGNPPDVAQLGFDALDFAAQGLGAKQLDDLVGSNAVQANFGGSFPYYPSVRTLGDVNGKTYGVPFVLSTPVLYYNATLFQQAGLNPAEPPTTWAQVQQDAQKIKQVTGKDGSYLDCLTKSATDWCFQSLVDSNGGKVISGDRSTLTFDQKPVVQVVQAAQNLVKTNAMPNLSQLQAVTEFTRGDLGMMLESSSLQGTFMQGAKNGGWTLQAAGLPSYAGHATVPTNSGAALFIFAKDPAKQRAAWDLIQFLTSPQSYDMITSKIGYLPLRSGLLTDPAHLQTWAAQNPLITPNVTQLAHVQPWTAFPGSNYQEVRDTMMSAVEKAVFDNADPQTTLSAAEQQAAGFMPTGSK